MANKPKFVLDMTDVNAKAQALLAFDSRKDGLILEGLGNGMNFAVKLATTKFMVGSSGGSRDLFRDPPNPPPGPLKIRSGRLRRTVRVIKPKKKGKNFISGLQSGSKYAAIHEFGGSTPPHTIIAHKSDNLMFIGKDGGLVFRESVNHPGSNIPPRPFMKPAIDEAGPRMEIELTRAMVNGLRAVFGGGSIPGISSPSLLGF